MSDVVIVSAARTPIGSFNGALASLTGAQLGTIALKSAMERAGIAPDDVNEVILGQVLTAAQGQNPARQAAIHAGIPNSATAWGLNQVCGSGLRAVALAAQQIADGSARIVAAGGQESMSRSAHAAHLRDGVKMGDWNLIDTMIRDGLWDAFNGYHMGTTAENVARQWQITREDQDAFAVASQNKAEAAQAAGKFKDEITPVTISGRKGDVVVDADEYIKKGVTLDSVTKLRPAFAKDGTVTAANASGINDGAAVLMLMSAAEAAKRGLTPLARIASSATAGVDPAVMGSGPIPASKLALQKGGLEGCRSRSRGSQRSLRRPGLRREQGHGLGHRQGERQRRRHRARSSDRCLWRACPHHPSPRDEAPQRQEGPDHALHRRRHGHRHVRRAVNAG